MHNNHEIFHLDVSQVVPEVQSIVRAAVTVYLHHLGQWCKGVDSH
jgi:hypothetical protein